jgi:hypothetical protein
LRGKQFDDAGNAIRRLARGRANTASRKRNKERTRSGELASLHVHTESFKKEFRATLQWRQSIPGEQSFLRRKLAKEELPLTH